MKKNSASRFARNFMAGAVALFGANAMTSCDTTGAGGEVPNPNPKPDPVAVNGETSEISEVWVSYAGAVEEFHFVNAKTKRVESYLNSDSGDITIDFKNDLETDKATEHLYGYHVKNTDPDTIDIRNAKTQMLKKRYILLPSPDADGPNADLNAGYSLLYAGGDLEQWDNRLKTIKNERFKAPL